MTPGGIFTVRVSEEPLVLATVTFTSAPFTAFRKSSFRLYTMSEPLLARLPPRTPKTSLKMSSNPPAPPNPPDGPNPKSSKLKPPGGYPPAPPPIPGSKTWPRRS